MRAPTIAVAATLVAGSAHADVPADAIALFDQGIKDLQEGATDKACKELAASLARYADSGTKGALAECYTQLGRVVSAWQLWKGLADTAPTADLRADAAANATALEPRMPHFVIRLAGAPPPGFAITVNGTVVVDPTLEVPLPADPGPLVVVASAPERVAWTHTFAMTEHATETVVVPELEAVSTPVVVRAAPIRSVEPAVHDDVLERRHHRHVIGGWLAVGGAVAAGAGAYFGSKAYSGWSDVQATCGGSIDHCPAADRARTLADAARTDALASTLLFGTGGAAIVAGAIVWLSAPNAERHLGPTVSPSSVGLSWSGAW